MVRTRFGRKTTGILAALTVTAAMGVMSHGAAVAATAPAAKATGKHHTDGRIGDKHDYDARQGSSATSKGAISRRAARASSRVATQQLRSSLGNQALVEMDGTTGTPRIVARLDGFLTRASSKTPYPDRDGLRVQPPRGTRPHAERPRDLPAAPRLPRPDRHPPPVLEPVAGRHGGVRQRAPGQRHQVRPAAEPRRLPDLRALQAEEGQPARRHRRRGDLHRPRRRRRAARRRSP